MSSSRGAALLVITESESYHQAMSSARISEFHVGTGAHPVLVSKSGRQPWVHVDPECPAAKKTIGSFATEKMARAAIPGMKACKTCRT